MAWDTSGESVWFTLHWWGELWESYRSSWSLGRYLFVPLLGMELKVKVKVAQLCGQPFPPPGIFPTQGSNPGLPCCRQILYELSHKGSPRILEWAAFPSCRDLPNPGIEPRSPMFQADSLRAEPQGKPKNTGVGSLSLLQGIFLTQGLNPGLPCCRQILYELRHKGSPRILEWVAYLFSSRSSWPGNRTGVSCIAGGFFTSWAIRETPGLELVVDLICGSVSSARLGIYNPSLLVWSFFGSQWYQDPLCLCHILLLVSDW